MRSATILMLSTVAVPTCALAQTTEPADLDGTGSAEVSDIVVTARKREENVKDVPLTVNVLNQQQLASREIHSLADLTQFTPGINFIAGNQRNSSGISIRGMTQISPVGDNRRDLVTVFIDGVPYVGNPSGIAVDGVQRVEVIKGPQSALLGRATFGGAISITSQDPGNTYGGRISVTAATYDDYRLSAIVSLPLVKDVFSLGAQGEFSRFGGFYKNTLGGRLGRSDRNFGALTGLFTPADGVRLKLRYSIRRDEDGEAASTLIARYPTYNCGPFPGFLTRSLTGLPASITTVGDARRLYCGPLLAPTGPIGINVNTPAASAAVLPFTTHGLILRHEQGTGIFDWEFAHGFDFSATASKQRQRIKSLFDFERTAEDRYQAYGDNIQDQDFYEARVTTPTDKFVSAMIGVAKIKQTFSSVGAFINGTLFGAGAGGPAPTALIPAVSKADNEAVFGSLTLRPFEKLTLIAEARRQKEVLTAGVNTPGAFAVETKATLPRFIVSYKPTDELTAYFNFAKGNQPSSGNSDFFLLSSAGQKVAEAAGVVGVLPEAKLDNYEIGAKFFSADRRISVNLAAFYSKWIGRQGTRTLQVDIDGNGLINLTGTGASREVFNAVPFAAGDSNTRGVELESAFRPVPPLALGLNVAWAKTNITKALNEALLLRFLGLADGKGRKYPLVPEWSGSGFAEYTGQLGDNREFFVRGDVTYVGKRFDSILNTAYVPQLWRVNARVGYRTGPVELTMFVTNLFNNKTLEASRYNSDSAADPFSFQLSSSEAVLPRKRQIGLTVTGRF